MPDHFFRAGPQAPAEERANGTAKTNDEGVFTIPALISGLYTATISVKGFKQAKVTEIKIDAGKPSSFNVALEVGSQDQTVTIVGSAELLQTQTATVGTTLAPWGLAFIQSYAVDKRLRPSDLAFERVDVIAGAVMTGVIGFFIVIACAATKGIWTRAGARVIA